VAAGAGYSDTPLARKLGIDEGMRVALLDGPRGIEGALDPLPFGVELGRRLRKEAQTDLVVQFVTKRDQLARTLPSLVEALAPDGVIWVAWPKRVSKVPTDVSDHTVRELALPLGWVDTKVCAIDATWTALKLVLRSERRPPRH
jgi:hypothetical protein